jgi:dethiobiotin synthetase
MKSIFITGTDTDAGKTYVSTLLLKSINDAGFKTIGFKPIAAGCEQTPTGLRNDDALKLQSAANVSLPYELINPIALAPPIAPHIAAAQLGSEIDMNLVQTTLNDLQSKEADFLLVEGAGGWRLPISIPLSIPLSIPKTLKNNVSSSASVSANKEKVKYLSDFVADNKLPVILVVGMKLGCLNHAALTLEQIKRDNCHLIGWIANQVDPNMQCYAQNLESLHALLDAPFIGEVRHNQSDITLLEKDFEGLFS